MPMKHTIVTRHSWLVPGTRAHATLMPDLDWRYRAGLYSESKAMQLTNRALRVVVGSIVSRYGIADRAILDDLVHELHLRLAKTDAAAKYDPALGAPLTFIRGYAWTVVWEYLYRRKPPPMLGSETLAPVGADGDQLARLERAELMTELTTLLNQLSDGEMRALEDEFALPRDAQPEPIARTRRRRGANPEALPRAIDVIERLRQLAAKR